MKKEMQRNWNMKEKGTGRREVKGDGCDGEQRMCCSEGVREGDGLVEESEGEWRGVEEYKTKKCWTTTLSNISRPYENICKAALPLLVSACWRQRI